MACNCFEENRVLLKKSLTDHMGDQKYGVVDGSGETKYDGQLMNFSGTDQCQIAVKVNSEFRARKKNGEPKANRTKLENRLRIKFCPFCGVEHTGV